MGARSEGKEAREMKGAGGEGTAMLGYARDSLRVSEFR